MPKGKRLASSLIDSVDHIAVSIEGWSMKTKSTVTATLLAAKALTKFCEDHGRPVQALRSCMDALEAGDARTARTAFKAIPWGGMMSFGDWIPPVVQDSETPDYVITVFESLTERFYRLAVDLLEIKRGP